MRSYIISLLGKSSQDESKQRGRETQSDCRRLFWIGVGGAWKTSCKVTLEQDCDWTEEQPVRCLEAEP